MNKFIEAVSEQITVTENGMVARVGTSNSCVDLFYKIGASRGRNIVPEFTAAFVENSDLALRILQWARDVRGGAGERQLFRDILAHLELHSPESARKLLAKVPLIGRWDDIFVLSTPALKAVAYDMLSTALRSGDGLAAKWTPRKGQVAVELRQFMNLSPKQYRKMLVNATKVVETQMCSGDWDNINFSHVPSQASRIYRQAFQRRTERYAEYVARLVSGEQGVKINAGAIFPHDVIKDLTSVYGPAKLDAVALDVITQQWQALPNYVGDSSILPLVDVSGSMSVSAGNNTSVRCLDIAVSLGLYLADKNQGAFKDTFLTFSSKPQLVTLRGNIVDKVNQLKSSEWQMSTDIVLAISKILEVAINHGVPASDMPKMLLILSDMQFNQCVKHNDSAMKSIERQYLEAGYTVPQVVFWNLNSRENVPVRSDQSGAALVSGYSPSIMKSLLASDPAKFTPEGIMLDTVMIDRYSLS